MSIAEKQRIRFGPFELDVRTEELRKNGHKLKLQPQPIRVLAILLENPGELVTREEIHRRLWPADTFVDFEHGLNTAIKKLRLALSDEAETPKYVETLPRRGYRFIGAIEEAAREPEPTSAAGSPLSRHIESLESMRDSLVPRQPRRWSRLMWLLAGFGFVVLVSLGAILYSQVFPAAPRIVATRQLSHTRLQKSPDMECYLATDGSRVYYSEHRSGDRWVLSQVSVAGGESADLPSQPPEFAIYGSWLSGTELITARCCPNKLFAMPLPAGAPRPLDIPAGATWFAPIPDGSGVVYAFNGDKEMHRLKLPENVHTKLLSDRDVTWTRVSPDGKRIRWTSAGADGGMWEMGIEGSNPHPLPLPDGSHFGDWTSDGKLFFFLRWEKNATTLWAKREDSRFSLIKSKPVLLYAGPLELHSPVASTNSKELYAIGVDLRGELSVYEPSRFVPFLGGIPANYVSFSHDGKWIAYVSYPDGNLWRSRIDGSEKLQLTFNTSVFTPRWSPDDKLISFASSGFEYGAIYVISPEGGKPSLLLSGPERPADPTWSPDGKSIAYGGDLYSKPHSKVRILTLETMQSRDVPGSEGLFSPRWSPDGRYIVAHHTKKLELLLYSFTEQKWRPLLQGEWVGWEAWSHDSKYVYAFSATKNCIFRVEIKTGKIERIVSLKGIAWTNSGFRNAGWFDLTPDDRIMILRNTGTEEIYALQLEY